MILRGQIEAYQTFERDLKEQGTSLEAWLELTDEQQRFQMEFLSKG